VVLVGDAAIALHRLPVWVPHQDCRAYVLAGEIAKRLNRFQGSSQWQYGWC